jgi:hypothetical protein
MALGPNDRVDIVAGSYEGRRGTYLAPVGFRGLSGRVSVDYHLRNYTNLRLESLRAIVPSPPTPPRPLPASRVATTGGRPVSPDVGQTVDSLEDYRYQHVCRNDSLLGFDRRVYRNKVEIKTPFLKHSLILN